MFVRGYQMSDCKEITELFYNTVHTINAKDYTKEQFLKTKRSYYANITLIDEKIGEVLEVLKKYGQNN